MSTFVDIALSLRFSLSVYHVRIHFQGSIAAAGDREVGAAEWTGT